MDRSQQNGSLRGSKPRSASAVHYILGVDKARLCQPSSEVQTSPPGQFRVFDKSRETTGLSSIG